MTTETELLSLVATGDEEAMRQLYLLLAPRVRRYLWHQLGGDSAAVDETVQDVFLAVWRTAGAYRGDAKVPTWIFQIAHYRALHSRRQRGSFAASMGDEWTACEGGPGEPLRASHENEVIERIALGEALRRLSAKHQEVIYLVSRQGFTLEETAQILDLPLGTVKSRMSYACQALLRALTTTSPEDVHHDA